jgi:hypothetical protein
MNTRRSMLTSIALILACFGPASAAAEEPATPPLVQQLNNGNWLPQAEAEALRDELYYQRAIHAYMTMLPALITIGMRDGSEATFGKGYNVLPGSIVNVGPMSLLSHSRHRAPNFCSNKINL